MATISIAQTYAGRNEPAQATSSLISLEGISSEIRTIDRLSFERNQILDMIYPPEEPAFKRRRELVPRARTYSQELTPVREYFLLRRNSIPTEAEFGAKILALSFLVEDIALLDLKAEIERHPSTRETNRRKIESFEELSSLANDLGLYARVIYQMNNLSDLSQAPFQKKYKLTIEDCRKIIDVITSLAKQANTTEWIHVIHPAILYAAVKIYNQTYPLSFQISYLERYKGEPVDVRSAFLNLNQEMRMEPTCENHLRDQEL